MHNSKVFISKDTSRGGVFYIYYIGDDGKRKRKSLKTKDQKKAETELSKLKEHFLRQEQIQLANERNKYTLEKLICDILQYIEVNHSFGTYRLYKDTLKYFQRFLGENVEVSSITIQDLERFKSERLRFVKPTTVNSYLRKIKASFNHAVRLGLIENSPIKNVSMLREYQSEKRIFENEQIDLITNRIIYTPFKNFILFGLYTGCRLSEILNLEWTDIDLNNRTITIRNKVNFKTKSGKIRRIPISDKLMNIIKEMNIITHEGYIFRNELNQPFTKDAITKRFKNVLKNGALPDYFHFHCLRHTFITNLIKKGVSIYLVKELAGHADIKTTIGYTHIVTDDLRDALNML